MRYLGRDSATNVNSLSLPIVTKESPAKPSGKLPSL